MHKMMEKSTACPTGFVLPLSMSGAQKCLHCLLSEDYSDSSKERVVTELSTEFRVNQNKERPSIAHIDINKHFFIKKKLISRQMRFRYGDKARLKGIINIVLLFSVTS